MPDTDAGDSTVSWKWERPGKLGGGGPNSAQSSSLCVSNGEPEMKKPWHAVACEDPHPVPGNLEVTKPETEIPD